MHSVAHNYVSCLHTISHQFISTRFFPPRFSHIHTLLSISLRSGDQPLLFPPQSNKQRNDGDLGIIIIKFMLLSSASLNTLKSHIYNHISSISCLLRIRDIVWP